MTIDQATVVLLCEDGSDQTCFVPKLTSTFQPEADRPDVMILTLSGISKEDTVRFRQWTTTPVGISMEWLGGGVKLCIVRFSKVEGSSRKEGAIPMYGIFTADRKLDISMTASVQPGCEVTIEIHLGLKAEDPNDGLRRRT